MLQNFPKGDSRTKKEEMDLCAKKGNCTENESETALVLSPTDSFATALPRLLGAVGRDED